jgi:dihydrofolate reductase
MPRKSREGQAKKAGLPNRRVRYAVAMSLDGFIAGPSGEADWIIMDPEIDFKAIYSQFDTMVMGRRTFEAVKEAGGGGSTPGMEVFVISRTLRQEDHPGVRIVTTRKG